MADLVDDIKSRLSIEDVVSQYVQLKKAGRNFKGLCPFHSEKTPSFIVSPEKQICHCFGCNKGGDIFVFIQELEGISFVEALEVLADRAGLKADISKYRKKVDKNEKDEYFKAHELATDYFCTQLYKGDDGKKVLQYLYKRGLTDETIKEFKIGFAPDKYDELYPLLLKKGISKGVLLKSGLATAKKIDSDEIYDKYRARLMFPIFDYLGKICGFGGRALKKEQAPKYLNSPENLIYSKSQVLYGLSHAKKTVKDKDKIVLVEGYFDVILPYQEGIQNVVATSGTALSQNQARKIKRLTSNVISCFDSDQAGFEATKRAYFVLQTEGIELKVAKIDEKDPADYVRDKGHKFNEILDLSSHFVSFFTDRLLTQNDKSTLTGQQTIIRELSPCFQIMSSTAKDYFVRELASKLNIKENYLYDEMENLKLPLNHPARLDSQNRPIANSKMPLAELVLALLLEYPKLFSVASEILLEEDFSKDMKDVYKEMSSHYNQLREKFKAWDFEKGFLASAKQRIDVLRLYAEQRYDAFTEESLEIELGKLIDKIRLNRKIGKLKELQSRITEAEKADKKDELNDLLREQQSLLNN